jgi:formylglycine-generating enzyme required for sulfatase activity/predicted MPP superfamily phosphohydrolase/nucleotide-binding universal stress UspA family protein
MSVSAIRWLHISDLHLGQRGGEIWWQVRDELERSLAETMGQLGSPHVILLTGDLVFSGRAAEYDLVDRFLDDLSGWVVADGGPDPLVVAVPGNHDLAWPSPKMALQYLFLDHYDDLDSPEIRSARKLLWEERDPSIIAPLFESYSAWAEKSLVTRLERRGVEVCRSFFPGDLSLIAEPVDGFRLGIVGLNSAWAQYRKGDDFEGRLQLSPAQLQAALPAKPGKSPLDWFSEVDAAILLTHHPCRWLSPKALSDYHAEIDRPGRFALALYGHMHQGQSEVVSVSGTQPRASFQSPSLFGLEHYGTREEARAMGYSWGQVDVEGEVRVWPLARVQRGDGSFAFDRDQRFEQANDAIGGVILRPGNRPTPPGPTPPPPPSPPPTTAAGGDPPEDILQRYLDWARGFFGRLDLVGLGGGDLPMSLDDVYVPLRMGVRGQRVHAQKVRTTEEAATLFEEGSPQVELDQALTLAGGRGLFILGQPGSGKTTALKKLLWQCLQDGRLDSSRIGLPRDAVPIFVRARSFLNRSPGQDFGAFVGQTIEQLSDDHKIPGDHKIPASFGPAIWSRGRVLLLVDGLDELVETPLRARVAEELDELARTRAGDGIRIVISCRYSGLDDQHSVCVSYDHFMTLDVPNLTSAQTRELVTRWFEVAEVALARGRGEDVEAAKAAGSRRGPALAATLETEEYATRRVSELVRNPLLLTLLCIVVLRGGEIPKRRVDFFRGCLDTLLGRWSKDRSVTPLLDASPALELLGPLAWQMHVDGRKYDYSEADIRAVLHDHLNRLQTELRLPTLTLRNLVRWLHETTGVLTEYAPGEYGFMHLSLQEYLAARHAAVERLAKDLVAFVAQDDRKWWREVVRLHVGLGEHRTFAPLMREVLAVREPRDLLTAEKLLWTRCVEDAQHPDFTPLRETVADTSTSPERRAAALELMLGHVDKELVALAKDLAMEGREQTETPLSTMAKRVVEVGEYDLFVSHNSADKPIVRQVTQALARQGLRVWLDETELLPGSQWQKAVREAIEASRAAAVFIGPHGEGPWQTEEMQACLSEAVDRGMVVVPVLLPGLGTRPELPLFLRSRTWLDLREGIDESSIARLISGIRGAEGEARITSPVAGDLFVEPTTGIRCLLVPAGTFEMGEAGISDEELPVHQVQLSSPFWLGETPVTNQQYGEFLKSEKHSEPSHWSDDRFNGDDQPVVGVSWDDAVAFCAWLSRKSGRRVELPTEAQWEFAARGPERRRYPWGDGPGPDETRAWFNDTAGDTTHPVGRLPAGRGPFGHLDLAGNVWEWCRDVWNDDAYKGREGKVTLDPFVEDGDKERRPVRGGCWLNQAQDLRAACRGGVPAGDRLQYRGFRVCVAPASTRDPSGSRGGAPGREIW